ncbi:hypothetical protein O0I10_006424, partial [Lichtheimia ornata]
MASSPVLEPTLGCFDTNNTGHQDVKTFLEHCGQLKYLETFINEGFESTAAICEVTEDDMIAMDVKRGHRRMIQRQIAATRGIMPKYPHSVASETSASFYDSSTMVDNTSTSSGNGNGKKRKYRRHPKRDKNAPKRPPSAYIMFSNEMRAKINDKSKTFTEMAKTIGELWKNLDPNKKQAYELEAMKAKDAYQIAMQQYRKTSEHKEYQQYLKEFKQKDKDNNNDTTIQQKSESPSSGSMADSSSNNGTDSQQVFLVQLPNKSSAGAGDRWL